MHGRPPDKPEQIRRSFSSFVKEYAFAKESEIFAVIDPAGRHCAQLWLHLTNNRFSGIPELWIWDITVRESERGRGLGKALMNLAIENARLRGAAELWLLVSSKNAKAIGIYRNFGLSEAGYLMSAEIKPMLRSAKTEIRTQIAGLRPLYPTDVTELYVLWQAAGLHFKPRGRDREDRLTAHLANSHPGGWCIEQNSKMVAGCLTSTDGRKGWIERLATLPLHQRSGFGKALVAAAKQSLLDSGNLVIGALIENDNQASRALFEAAGFLIDNDYHYFSFRQSPDA